jgi:hypothetical protein
MLPELGKRVIPTYRVENRRDPGGDGVVDEWGPWFEGGRTPGETGHPRHGDGTPVEKDHPSGKEIIPLPESAELVNLLSQKEAPFVPIMAELPAEDSGPDPESRDESAGNPTAR